MSSPPPERAPIDNADEPIKRAETHLAGLATAPNDEEKLKVLARALQGLEEYRKLREQHIITEHGISIEDFHFAVAYRTYHSLEQVLMQIQDVGSNYNDNKTNSKCIVITTICQLIHVQNVEIYKDFETISDPELDRHLYRKLHKGVLVGKIKAVNKRIIPAMRLFCDAAEIEQERTMIVVLRNIFGTDELKTEL